MATSESTMILRIIAMALVAAQMCVWRDSLALEASNYAVQASVQAQSSPPRLVFSWPHAHYAREYVVRRKNAGDSSWGNPVAVLPGHSTGFTDGNVSLGAAYEYEIQMATSFFPWPGGNSSQWIYGYSYLYAGVEAALQDFRGKVLLVVDSSIASPLNSELASYAQNLVGDGWVVLRRDVSRTAAVSDVKNVIRSEYNAHRNDLKAVVLIGHVPVPYSGAIAPDLHPSHRGAWPADGFYGEMDGSWTDHQVSMTSQDSADNDNFPGDGKYDQSTFPSDVDLAVGRIDLWNMTSFLPKSEVELLRNYFRKNHQFRHRQFTAARRGVIRDNFGDLDGDAPAVDAWRHYAGFFGTGSITEIGPNSFFSTLGSEACLWAYGGGGGGYKKADTVGTTTDFAQLTPKAVFYMLHGSYFGDWNNEDNFLRAAIGTREHGLASIWSGLPHWYMHHMALGGTVGYSTRVSQNNVNLYKSHQNFSAREVHISLIGDPTLQMFPVIPPGNLNAQAGNNVNLSWNASTDQNLAGYHVYYSGSASGPYQRLTASPVAGTSYSHSVGTGTHYYMVRAIKLERTGSGSFYNGSQGIFASVTKSSGGGPPTVSVAVEDGSVSEDGPDAGSFRVTRSSASASPLSVSLVMSGTAQNGGDYISVGSSVTIPASATTVTIPITPISDSLVEGNETVVITLQPSLQYNLGNASASLQIADKLVVNERPTISPIADQTVAAGGQTADIPFSINDPETPAGSLDVRAGSSDQTIIPLDNIIVGGSGGNRTIRVSALPGKTGVVKITVIVSDGSLEATRNFFVTVEPPNQPPVATSLEFLVTEDTPTDLVLLASDPEGAPLQYVISGVVTNGTLSGSAPNLVYTPHPNYTGTDRFTFVVRDGVHESLPASVSITIVSVNDPPVARGQEVVVQEDSEVLIELDASDPDSSQLTFKIIVPPVHGALAGVGNAPVYKPGPDFHGVDSFQFTVSDGITQSAPATVVITVQSVNDVPVAHAGTVTTAEDTAVEITLMGSDAEGTPLSYILVTQPAQGQISGNPPNLVYTPARDFHGTDSFEFKVFDGALSSVAAKCTIHISSVDDPPVAIGQTVEMEEDKSVGIILKGSDVENGLLEFAIVSAPANGTLSGEGSSWVYTPMANFHGTDSFSFSVNDGVTNSETATVTCVVLPRNDPPAAGTDELSLPFGVRSEIALSELLSNDTDIDGDILQASLVKSASERGGVLTMADELITYTPPPGFAGADQFEYRIEDPHGGSATGTVLIQVGDAPRIRAIRLLGDGRVSLSLEGQPGASYEVWVSSDYQVWRLRGEGVADETGAAEFLDESARKVPFQVYEVRWSGGLQ